MRFSLITGTLGRSEVLQRLLRSLESQTHQDFELIVVDQNEDDRVEEVLQPFQSKMEIRHLRLEKKGLSRARNHGLGHASGDVIGFPDDDCWYPEDLLENIESFLQRRADVDGVTARSYTEEDERTVQFAVTSGSLNLQNVFGHGKGISYCIFLRDEVVRSVGEFDEKIGVGADSKWGSGEETDYLIRSIKKNFNIYHISDLRIYHPKKEEVDLEKVKKYGIGIGHVFRKNNISLPLSVWALTKVPIGAIIFYSIKINMNRIKVNWVRLKSRVYGLFW